MTRPRFELVSYASSNAQLPRRADPGSAGYDFYLPHSVVLNPNHTELVLTDVKAFMPPDVVLLITIRSSLARSGIILANAPGVVDASYYNNPTNEGNIGLLLHNISSKRIVLHVGDRVAQGVFVPYLIADNDTPLVQGRDGGFGSSGR